jgi:hypothetical protein
VDEPQQHEKAIETGNCLGVLPEVAPGADKVDSGKSERTVIELASAASIVGPGRQNET